VLKTIAISERLHDPRNRLDSSGKYAHLRRILLLFGLMACSRMVAQGQPSISGLLVNGVASSTGPVGATLTIQGSGFGASQGFSTATLNGTYLAGNGVRPTSWSNTSIVVVIPNTASSGPVVVKVSGKSSNAVTFSIGAVIAGISPGTALAGNWVTITGQGFGTSVGTVTFNGATASSSSWSDASVVAQVPNGATAGPVVVTVNGVASNGMGFTPTPAISSLSPSYGLSGATVTIAGNSFGSQPGTVSFSGVSATVNAWSNTSITVAAPSGALSGNVVVTVNGITSAGRVFTYTPQISSLSPNPALAETTVQVQGNNFGAQQGNGTISFNGVMAAVSSWSNTGITATVPGNAKPGPVVVTVNGVASNGVSFSLPSLYSFSLGYASNGDVVSANDSVNGNWTYSYDDFNRLMTANSSGPQQGYRYSYDRYGNRWGQDLTAGTGRVDDMTFAVTTASTVGNCYHAAGLTNQPDGYCYDAAGNLLSDGSHSYSYDAENRIIQVDGGQSATYSYDADGNRIQKTSAGGTAAYLYDLAGHVITEMNGSGVWTRGEVYAGGKHLATYGNGSSGTTYFAQVDWVGTERTRVLPSGDVFETCSSLPFGDGLVCNGSADPSPNHLTGKERDPESNIHYLGARYYSNSTGKFLTADPMGNFLADLGNPQSWNLYSYVLNNPLIYTDPSGEECVWDNGSFDSADDPDTGSNDKCHAQGGTWVDPDAFENSMLTNGQMSPYKYGDWSSQPNPVLVASWLGASANVYGGADAAKQYMHDAVGAFLSGKGPRSIEYPPDNPFTLSFQQSAGMDGINEAIKSNCSATSGKSSVGTWEAFVNALIDAFIGDDGVNTPEAQLGAFNFTYTRSAGVAHVTVTNPISLNSLAYHATDPIGIKNPTSGKLSTVHQTLHIVEPDPCP
jgi:RHS repeat-associated protein